MGLLIRESNEKKIIGIKEAWATRNAKDLKEITDFMHGHSVEYEISYPTHKAMTDNTQNPVLTSDDYLMIKIDKDLTFDNWATTEAVFERLLSFKKKYGQLPWHTHQR